MAVTDTTDLLIKPFLVGRTVQFPYRCPVNGCGPDDAARIEKIYNQTVEVVEVCPQGNWLLGIRAYDGRSTRYRVAKIACGEITILDK